jgi:hypothetical protein
MTENSRPSLLSRAQALIADLGWCDAGIYLLDTTLHRLTKRQCVWKYYFYAQPVPAQALLPPSRGKSIEVIPIPAGDPVITEISRPQQVIDARYRQGAVCLGAYKANRLIGFLWLVIGPYNEDEVRCRFQPHPQGQAAWDFDVYLDPVNRAGFAFGRLWDEANAYLCQRGVLWTMSRISAFNLTSIRSHQKLGAAKIGSALYLRAGDYQMMLSTLAPYVHLSTKAESIPTIRLPSPERSVQPP